jgi:hypothetical protein
MPTPLRRITIVPKEEQHGDYHLSTFVDRETGERPKAGDVFYAPHLFDRNRGALSPLYWEDWNRTQRPPIVVVLPNGQWWCVDELAISKQGRTGQGWRVSGSIDTTPITLTVMPSINTRTYHGVLSNGSLSDDLGNHYAG